MSVESFGFKFVVDAKDAAKGYGDFQRAVDGVFASMQRFEQQAKKSIDAVTASSKRGQGDIQKYAAQFKALQSIPIDGSAAPKLLKLSDAMARFKAPSTTQVSNLRSFFTSLQKLPDLSATTRSISNIAKLSAAMNGFKAPSSAQAVKLVEFAKALQTVGPGLASLGRVAGVSGVANELASISIALGRLKIPSAGQAQNLIVFSRALQMMRLGGAGNAAGMLEALSKMNGFKAPTAAQTKNLQSFVNAINNLKVPENANQIAAYLMRIAEAARSANASLQGFRGSLNSLGYGMNKVPWGGFTSGAHKARLEMMGMQNAFSGTFQVGSLLRSLLGSLTISELGRGFFSAVQAANQFHASMEVLGQSPMMQSKEWERVRADANHFGMDLKQYAEQFGKFAVAAHESGMSLAESFKVFEGFSTVMSGMHLGAEQQQSVGLAIREIMDQGYVSTQRLTRQLGLVLPGATATLQAAWKKLHPEINFWDALKKKMVDGQWALDTLADHYKTVYGPALAAALQSPIQQFNILRNNISEMMIEIGNDGAKKAFADFIAKLSGGLDPSHMKAFTQSIADGLVKALHRAGDAVDWLRANWDRIRGPLGAALSLMGKWMVLSSAFKIGSSLITPLLNLRGAMLNVNKTMLGSTESVGILSKGFSKLGAGIAPLPTGLGRLNLSLMATTSAANVGRVALNGLKMAGSGLLSLVGGPLGLAFIGLTAIIGGVTSHMMNASMQVSEMQSAVKDALDPLSAFNGFLSQATKNSIDAANGVSSATTAAHDAIAHLDKAGNAAQTAAQKYHQLAVEARNAALQMNAESIMKLQTQNADAQQQTTTGAAAKFRGKMPTWLGGDGGGFNSMSDFFGSAYGSATARMAHDWDNGASDKALTDSIAKNTGTIHTLLLARHDMLVATDKQWHDSQYDPLNDTGKPHDSEYSGTNAGKHKGKKGPDPEKQLKAFENQMSEIMDKLMDGDPVGKLASKFVQDLTKQGQILLNNKSFHDFLKGLNNDALHGKVSVDSLIHALENGGIKGKALADLKARYGTDVSGIISLLRKEQNEYEDAVKDATAKAIKEQYKGVDDALKKMAEHNPLLKLNLDMSDALEQTAHDFLNSTAFTDWLKHTETDADGAATALNRLISKLRDAGSLKDGVGKALAGRGLSVENSVIPSLQIDGAQNEWKKQQEQRKMDGSDVIDQMKQEYMLAKLNNGQTEIASKLLAEYNRQMELFGKANLAQIDTMQQQLIYWQKQIDLMKEQKAFYENNGIKTYLADIKTAGEFVHDFDNNFLKGLEDTLYNLGTTGKLSFKSLFDSMQQSIIRFASQGLTEKFAKLLNPHAMDPNDKNPTMFGFLGKMLGGKKGNDFQQSNKSIIQESEIQPMKVWVNNIGQLQMGGGGSAGGIGGLFDGSGNYTGVMGNGMNPTDADISADPFNSLGDMMGLGIDGSPNGGIGSSVAGSISSSMTAIQPLIQQTFGQTFKGLGGQFGGIFSQLLGSLTGGGGGGGGMGGGLMNILGSLLGGGGGAGGAMSAGDASFMSDSLSLMGFSEGGISGNGVGRQYRMPSSAFVNAPHYAEGTSNTSGMPAVLHDNEAVIPLSRNRKVPVQLTNGNGGGNGPAQVVQNFNISSPDSDSFRKSRTQIATELHAVGARSWTRNNV